MILQGMESLQVLNIPLPDYAITSEIFTLSSNLKELSFHYEMSILRYYSHWLEQWANFNYVPRKLNLVFADKPRYPDTLISSMQSCLPMLRNKKLLKNSGLPDIAWFSIYFSQPTMVPYVQLKVTESAMFLPLVKASNYGLLGLEVDTLHLTESTHRGNIVHKALLINGINAHIDVSVASLTTVTYFDASHCSVLYPGHLEQLSIACPNLQKLDLYDNSNCLRNLQGLHSLANNCKSLQALNLREIYHCENDCVELWEILCTMRLTQLSIEAWMININIHNSRNARSLFSSLGGQSVAVKQQRLIAMFQNYLTLQVLEMEMVVCAGSCNNLSDNELLLVSYFPSITSYRLCNLPKNNCCYTLKRIFISRYLRCLFLSKSLRGILSLSLEGHCSCLQQLYIDSRDTVPTDAFIDALCDHGGLEHVILRVKSLTAKSIGSIIEHSSNLVTFDVTFCSRAFLKTQLKQLIANLKMRFSKRQLFNGGNFSMRRSPISDKDKERLMHQTNLFSVWDSN